jgi:hypothetical protein
VANRQLLGGDDPLGLVADVEKDLVPVDLHDGPGEDVSVLEVLQALLDGLDQLLGRVVVRGRRGDALVLLDPGSAPLGGRRKLRAASMHRRQRRGAGTREALQAACPESSYAAETPSIRCIVSPEEGSAPRCANPRTQPVAKGNGELFDQDQWAERQCPAGTASAQFGPHPMSARRGTFRS